MSSSHENDQKSQELHCLQIAIEAKKQQKGESRKILEFLAGEDVYHHLQNTINRNRNCTVMF